MPWLFFSWIWCTLNVQFIVLGYERMSLNQYKHDDSIPQVIKQRYFPTAMVSVAACFSAFMVFMISAVFMQANAPCAHHYAEHDSVIVDTTHSISKANTSKRMLAICNRDQQQIGWLTWLFNHSETMDLHYLVLLELLSRK